MAEAHATDDSIRTAENLGRWTRHAGIADVLSDTLFVLLLVVNVVRTLRHAMWRDELQIFMLAANSSSPWDLLLKLKYEGHPGLWHALVWMITLVTSDPRWMQVLHIALATGVWVLIYRRAPFSKVEKILLLLSYFLFWEYFIISRSYVLLALIGFGFIVLRERRPRPDFVHWLLLGLLANVHVFGAMWSMALAATLVIQGAQRRSMLLTGGALYLVLLGLAIATMMPAADYGPWGADVRFDVARLNNILIIPVGAFVPTRLDTVAGMLDFLAHPSAAAAPDFWNANPAAYFNAVTQANIDHPVRLALMLAAPVVACWVITRDLLRVLEFSLVYVGILLFAVIWDFPGSAHHHGVVFLAFIAACWSARLHRVPDVWSSSLFRALLIVNAFAGLLTLASEAKPFSQGRSTAAWIKQNNLADAFLIGSRDAQASAVVGFLGRPIYYLECECYGTFIVWNNKRLSLLPPAEFRRRLAKAVDLAGQRDVILVRYRPVTPEELAGSKLSATLLESFTGSWWDENFWIYRVIRTSP